jgi:hypothetical protein
MTLIVGDIVTLAGIYSTVFVVAGVDDKFPHKRFPEEPWCIFRTTNPEREQDKISPISSATLVARPNWETNMPCVWNGCDARVSSVDGNNVYLEWGELSHIVVPVQDLTIANYSLFINRSKSNGNAEKAA